MNPPRRTAVTPAQTGAALGALRSNPCPDAHLEALVALSREDLAQVAATPVRRLFRRTKRNSPPVQDLLRGYPAARGPLVTAASDLIALAEATGAPVSALAALARPYPAGALASLPLDDLGALAMQAPTRGWVRLWDNGRIPLPLPGEPPTPDITGHARSHREGLVGSTY